MWAPETVVARSGKRVRSGVMSVELCTIARCIRAAFARNSLFAGDNLGPWRGGNAATGGGGGGVMPVSV